MATCDKLHPDCERESERIQSLRLIDVGSPDGKQLPALIEGFEDTREVEYITLSYRWGNPSADMLTTTAETIDQRKAGIPMELLPKTMRDAVIITRRLGIRYLWIDALCIIQGSRTDWEEQSANMAQIYSRSVLSISAHGARTVHDGFLNPRNPLQVRGCIHPSLIPGRNVVICPDIIEPDAAIEGSILSQRGWTLQEQILPHRILHWGPHEVSWECRTMRATERRPLGKSKDSTRNSYATRTSPMEVRNDWVGLVENYSRRQLTVPSDKLPAISGLASSFQRNFSPPPVYIAGIWYEAAVPYLGWHRDTWDYPRRGNSNDSSTTRSETQGHGPTSPQAREVPSYPVRMPTFSWSSTDSAIKFVQYSPSPFDAVMAETVTYDLDLDGRSEFGAVKSASITLHGYTSRLQRPETPLGYGIILDDDRFELGDLGEDCLLLHLFCSIEQGAFRCSQGFSRESVSQHSLILLPEVSKGPETYRRIGLMNRSFSSLAGPGEAHQSVYPNVVAELERWITKEIVLV